MIGKRYKNDGISILTLNKIQLNAKNEIERKIKNNQYEFENIKCPVCNLDNTKLLSEKDRYGLFYTTCICINCGLVYVNPRMNQISFNKFYDTEYRKLYLGTEAPLNYYFDKQYKRGETIYNFINKLIPNETLFGLNILEVGCSAGGILLYFKSKGCNVLGVDLDSGYLNYGIDKYGLNLIHGTLQEIPTDFKPDIIIYSHVFEHILDLNKELQLLKNICATKTKVYIEVPGIKNVHKAYDRNMLHYFQNAHTFHFSLTTLTNLFKKNNFTLIKGDEFIRSLFLFEPSSKNSRIINDCENVMQYIKKIEKYRFLNVISYSRKKIKLSFIKNLVKILDALGLKKFVKGILKRQR